MFERSATPKTWRRFRALGATALRIRVDDEVNPGPSDRMGVLPALVGAVIGAVLGVSVALGWRISTLPSVIVGLVLFTLLNQFTVRSMDATGLDQATVPPWRKAVSVAVVATVLLPSSMLVACAPSVLPRLKQQHVAAAVAEMRNLPYGRRLFDPTVGDRHTLQLGIPDAELDARSAAVRQATLARALDPTSREMEERLGSLREDIREQLAMANCENAGTCGTGVPGKAGAYNRLIDEYYKLVGDEVRLVAQVKQRDDQLKGAVDNAEFQLDAYARADAQNLKEFSDRSREIIDRHRRIDPVSELQADISLLAVSGPSMAGLFGLAAFFFVLDIGLLIACERLTRHGEAQ